MDPDKLKAKHRKQIEQAALHYRCDCEIMWDDAVDKLVQSTGLDEDDIREIFGELT